MSKLDKIIGKTIAKISGMDKESVEVEIRFEDGAEITFWHEQECCEDVRLVDFECDTTPGAVIISAEGVEDRYAGDTWTFYKIETTKGEIWMRWMGESNGYYSEEVDIKFKEGSK